jgi:hypothetical protein
MRIEDGAHLATLIGAEAGTENDHLDEISSIIKLI